jgi:3-oxoacyl-[acyl-carrier protein] reductase
VARAESGQKATNSMADKTADRQVALVTGASRGIGRATALALAREGLVVLALGRSRGMLGDVVEEINSHGGEAHPYVCDLRDREGTTRALDGLLAEAGRIDLVVNNAGTFLECAAEKISLEDWEAVIRTNLTAPVLVCKGVLPLMYRQGRGRIVNIASVAGLSGYYHQSAYCAAKHGLLGYGRALAIEARPFGVHVNTICPGGVRTEFFGGTMLAERLAGQVMLEPKDIADAVLYLYRQPDNVDIPELVIRRAHCDSAPHYARR